MREVRFLLLILGLLCVAPSMAQSPNATLNGIVVDPSGAAIVGAQVVAVNDATGVQSVTKTNGEGIYVLPNLPPGLYRIQVSNSGFKTIIKPDITLHVQDAIALNFTLPIGAAAEVVTIFGSSPLLNTESAAVSTVVDRQFAENLPMNGRSFQTLIQLTPGVVLTASHEGAEGQFSVNGQRTASNNWIVDGVSANIGIGSNFNGGNGVAGAVGSFSVLGGTNSLVSVDALQEFRIQTSTYAPEFGRTPGAQISIVTRSGTDRFHGSAFDYLRNSDFDANNWFAGETGLPKPAERQNDIGGTLSGPVLRKRTFFFFSYEGLRLRLPMTTLTGVPDLNARQNANQVTKPFLDAYPLPNGSESLTPGVATFNASYSNPATLDAYSLRIDHKLSGKLALFGRYNYSPSESDTRGAGVLFPLSDVEAARITTQTLTAGVTWSLTPRLLNDFRFNYSTVTALSRDSLDSFGGAVPPTSLPIPSPYSTSDVAFEFTVFGFAHPDLVVGTGTRNAQRQFNYVDSMTLERASHELKFGLDYRRLTPTFQPSLYTQEPIFLNVLAASENSLFAAQVFSVRQSRLLLQNLGVFAQDSWRIVPRLSLTYGVRWDMDFPPSSLNGAALPAVTSYDLTNLSGLALAPSGTSPFNMTFGNVAPRLGLAYRLSQQAGRELVLRGGFGIFYDLATSQVGDLLGTNYPFGATSTLFGPTLGGTATFPLSSGQAAPPPITTAELSSPGASLVALDPHLKLPYTLEWNVAFQQQLGPPQSLSISYIGSVGRRLIQSAFINSPNQAFSNVDLIGNTASSDYSALQLQFERRLSRGLQALASYTWSHSIDDGSNGTFGAGPNSFVPGQSLNANRGPSDFDLRNVFSGSFTYDIPVATRRFFAKTLLGNWSVQSVVQAWSAPPVNVYYSSFEFLTDAFTELRPDVVPGVPLYLQGPQYPGGKALNPAAFIGPPTNANGNPLRQGNLGRNALRGFGAEEWDFAVHRDFPLHEFVKLQFRAEMFNVLNHPNFGPPVGDLQSPHSINPQFGLSTQILAQALGGSAGLGGFSGLYQVGGPRSIQLALKLFF